MNSWSRTFLFALIALFIGAGAANAQRAPGRYEAEFSGAVTGGATGVKATYETGSSGLVIVLPAVSSSYPSLRLVRRAGAPERAGTFAASGDGAEAVQVEFVHPGLSSPYVAETGTVRLIPMEGGALRGEYMLVASPSGRAGVQDLRVRGWFEALPRR